MRQFYSLPDPKALGFEWEAFEEAAARLENVRKRKEEAERTAEELRRRIEREDVKDIERLAKAIAAGEDDPDRPQDISDLAAELREQKRLEKALERAEPEAEGTLYKAVQAHREKWAPEVDKALTKAIAEERKAYQKAREMTEKARTRRQHLEELGRWVRELPASFGPPTDMAVGTAIHSLSQDADRAERQLAERSEAERGVA